MVHSMGLGMASVFMETLALLGREELGNSDWVAMEQGCVSVAPRKERLWPKWYKAKSITSTHPQFHK